MEPRSEIQFDCIGDLLTVFDSLVEAEPTRPMLHTTTGPISRAAVDDLSRAIESDVRSTRSPADSVVGVAVANGARFLASVLAVWRTGGVPLLIDSDTPGERRESIARSLGAVCLLHTDGVSDTGVTIRPTGRPGQDEEHRVKGGAVIKLTSGSTGAPRGILLSARAVAADTLGIEDAMGIGNSDRVVVSVPMSFSYGFGSLAIPALLAGRELVLPDANAPLGSLTVAREFAATVLPTTPAFLAAIVKREIDWSLPESLRLVVSAGAQLPAEVATQFRERFGLPVHVFYGASECGGITYDATGECAGRGTVGRPVPGVEVSLSDATGLVEVRSAAVATRYLPAASGLGDGTFVTSDRADWTNGELRLLGRQGVLINIRGHKINPREVEQVIATLPGVESAFVTAVNSPDADALTCCALVASDDGEVSRQRVHDWCLRHMPAFKLPRRILVVPRIPRNARGKVQVEAVRRLFEDSQTQTG